MIPEYDAAPEVEDNMTKTIHTEADHNNVSESQGWYRQTDGTWSALTRARSRSGFKTERGAKSWFIRNASPSTLAKMGLG